MDYELYLRVDEPSAAGARALLDAIRSSLGPGRSGGLGWRICHGTEETDLQLVPPDPVWWEDPDSTTQAGVDVIVPAGATHAHVDAVCDWLFAVTKQEEGIRVYDPQLGRSVSEEDREAIRERATELGTYLMDTLGAASGHGSLQEPGAPRRARVLWWVACGVAILWILLSRLAC